MRDELASIREAIEEGRPLTSAQCEALCEAIEKLFEKEGWDVEDLMSNAVGRGRICHRGTPSDLLPENRSKDNVSSCP